MAGNLAGKKVAILVDDLFEEAEFTGPLETLRAAGAEVHVVSPKKQTLQSLNHADKSSTYEVDYAIDEVSPADYDALVLPGGGLNADKLRMETAAREWVKAFHSSQKPLAMICHAPWVLVSAGLARGHTLTSYYTIQDDMRNAGANWVDEQVVVDGKLITSRQPDDVPAFSNAIITMLEGSNS
jgi:protease I